MAGGAAALDWIAVAGRGPGGPGEPGETGAGGIRRLEYAAKPTVLVAMTAAAATIPASAIDLVDRRWFFVAALACSLVGDVLLMSSGDRFVGGLLAFLVAHMLFIVGLLQPPAPPGVPPFAFSTTGLTVSVVVVVLVESVPGRVLIRALGAGGHRTLIAPVCLYIGALVTMVVLATNVGVPLAALGAVSFLLSDTLLAVDRFVRPLPRGTLAVHVSYHVAQGLLVLSLLR